MVSGSISLPCSGFFSPFPHGTGSLSVSWEYLALPGGPGRFRQDSSCPALLRILLALNRIARTRLSLSAAYLSRYFRFFVQNVIAVLQPRKCRNTSGLGSYPFARRYLGNRCFFLFLLLLRCFSSEGWLTLQCDRPSACRVVPFGYLRIKSRLQIPAAFRSLPRPS